MRSLIRSLLLLCATSCVLPLALGLPAWADDGDLRGVTRQVDVTVDQLLADYARSVGLAAEHLAWANALEPDSRVTGGESLKLPARIVPQDPPREGAVVNLAERGVYIFRDGELAGFFPLAIGQESDNSFHTPTGEYKVTSRVKNPSWTAPDSDWAKAMEKDRIAPDDPSNPLGEYWFGIDHPDGGYGFHENTNPTYTGDTVSHGCMRLNPEHAAQIYDQRLLDVGMTVRIENRPIVFGTTADGELMVATFPSTYQTQIGVEEFEAALASEHLGGMVSQARMLAFCERPSGVPTRLLGPPVTLVVNGADWKGKPGILRAGSVIVPAALARQLGCQVQYHGEAGDVAISRGGKRQTFVIEGEDRSAFRWGDDTMVPARDLFDSLSIPFQWNPEASRLEITL